MTWRLYTVNDKGIYQYEVVPPVGFKHYIDAEAYMLKWKEEQSRYDTFAVKLVETES